MDAADAVVWASLYVIFPSEETVFCVILIARNKRKLFLKDSWEMISSVYILEEKGIIASIYKMEK